MKESILEIVKSGVMENKIIFSFTGDLDNLGIYVAKNGRAWAECLVDLYNEKINELLTDFCNKNKIEAKIFLSGEEVFGIGYVENLGTFDLFNKYLDEVANIIKNFDFHENEYVGISFGCLLVENEICNEFLKDSSFESYIKFMVNIRSQLAISLDASKFEDLKTTDNVNLIAYRNVVYSRMLKYKEETKIILKHLSNNIEKYDVAMKNFGDEYGITAEDRKRLDEIMLDEI